MSVSQVASRYARSLLDLATEQGKTDIVKADMVNFQEALKSRELVLLLKSPIIYPDKKLACLKAIFEGKMDDLTMAFFNLSVKKGRESLLIDIAEEFNTQYNAQFNIALVKVTSATALDAATTEKILSKVRSLIGENMTIQLETKIDPVLIGGFIIQFEDKLYDSSVLYQMNKLKQTFSQN